MEGESHEETVQRPKTEIETSVNLKKNGVCVSEMRPPKLMVEEDDEVYKEVHCGTEEAGDGALPYTQKRRLKM